MVEEFGIEEFGVEAPPAVPAEDPATLKEMIAELTKQAAETMDPEAQKAIRAVKKAAEERLAEITKETGILETQWVGLSKAYYETFNPLGKPKEFGDRLAALGGVTNENYHLLTKQLSEHHQAADAKPKGGKGKGKKAKDTPEEIQAKADAIPLPTAETRWPHVIAHAKNLGFSAQVVFDELGYTELTDESVGHTLREVNNRANPDPPSEVEEFGAGESPQAGTVSTPAIPVVQSELAPAAVSSADPASGAVQPTTTATVNSSIKPSSTVWDDVLQRLIDPDTGTVIERSYFLEVLGLPEMPTEPDKEIAAKILDVMHTRFLDPAARYRAQAEKMAKPLEAKADIWEQAFGPYLDACGDKFLPRVKKADSKNFGKLSSKTLDLITGSISWRGEGGGAACINEPSFHAWLNERKTDILALREQGTAEAQEELEMFERAYGLRLQTEIKYDRDKIKAIEGQLPPGWEILPENEFKTRTIK